MMKVINKRPPLKNIRPKNRHASITEFYDFTPLPKYEKVMAADERILQIPEMYCTEFGCSKELTREEKLCGGRCINHQKKKSNQFHANY